MDKSHGSIGNLPGGRGVSGAGFVGAADIAHAAVSGDMLRLREEKDRLQDYLDRIFGISSAIIYILDSNGHFIFLNRAVEEILNFSAEELIGKHFSFILPAEEYERVSREVVLPRLAGQVTGLEASPKLFNERRTGIRRTRDMEVRLLTRRRNDYRLMAGDVTGIVEVEGAYSLNDERTESEGGDGRPNIFLGSQGVIFDVTKYKSAELERLELHKRLFRIQKLDAIGKLAGRVAHDLNNSLGCIIGAGEMIKSEVLSCGSPAAVSYVESLLTASRRAAELANRLSEFSRKGDSGFDRIDVHGLIDKVMDLVRVAVTGGGISVHKILLSQNAAVMGSETMLQNAMLNVVMNAAEAMRKGGGVLTVETADIDASSGAEDVPKILCKRGMFLKISVSDTGVGMDDSVKAKLFDPFFTTDPDKGLGLGLVSIRECLRSHGGVMDIHSEPGKGTRFDIYLPKAGE